MPTLPEGAAALNISDTVVAKVAEMLAEEGDPSICSCASSSPAAAARASSTALPLTTRPRTMTCASTRGPITVVVDAMSLQYLVGAEIDFEDKLDGARFVIRNPNAAAPAAAAVPSASEPPRSLP
jgi:iron-sulfur cluster insertion protein